MRSVLFLEGRKELKADGRTFEAGSVHLLSDASAAHWVKRGVAVYTAAQPEPDADPTPPLTDSPPAPPAEEVPPAPPAPVEPETPVAPETPAELDGTPETPTVVEAAEETTTTRSRGGRGRSK